MESEVKLLPANLWEFG